MTNKGSHFESDIIIKENDVLLTDQKDISCVFNDFFINVAKDIGNGAIPIDNNHPSVKKITDTSGKVNVHELQFQPITEAFTEKQFNKINVKKATGFDEISPKILKIAAPVVVEPITNLINKTFETSVFPDKLKIAQVVTMHKTKQHIGQRKLQTGQCITNYLKTV